MIDKHIEKARSVHAGRVVLQYTLEHADDVLNLRETIHKTLVYRVFLKYREISKFATSYFDVLMLKISSQLYGASLIDPLYQGQVLICPWTPLGVRSNPNPRERIALVISFHYPVP